MKNIDIKSLIIGVLLATTIIFGMGATGKADAGKWDDKQRWAVFTTTASGNTVIGVSLGNNADDGVEGVTALGVYGSAAKAGLQIGDIITHINGKPYNSPSSMIAFVRSQKVGDKIEINLLRGAKAEKVKVPLVRDYDLMEGYEPISSGAWGVTWRKRIK